MRLPFIKFAILLTLLLSSGTAAVDRIEPANWWVGMKESTFQILLHGPSVKNAIPAVTGDQVSIERVERCESENYLFLYLHVVESAMPGSFEIRLDYGDGIEVEIIPYTLKLRSVDSSLVKGFDTSDVIYLAMPDRFANGDASNDIVPGMLEQTVNRSLPYARHGGDLAGVIQHLDYLQQLGITTLWLNPVLENNMPEWSYHGYAITDFYKVDPRFGTLEDYKMLATQAKAKGIKLIMDMVFNHCGSEHWWMNDLPSKDWINYSDDYLITNHLRTTNQDPYASLKDAELMSRGWFSSSMPDLNLANPLMADYMIQNSIWWIETLGLAGVRMDTYPYPDKDAMSRWCQRVRVEYPYFNITGEEWSLNPIVLSYWQEGKTNPDGYEGHLPSLIDFPLRYAAVAAFQEDESWGSGLIKLYEMLSNDPIYPDADNLVTFLSNHDAPRFFMEVGSNEDSFRNALVFLLTTRGIPQLLYGDEILMTHYESNEHGDIRKDFPGGWSGDGTNVFTSYNLSQRQARNLTFTKRLLQWRKAQDVIHHGKLLHFGPQKNCYVYFRYNDSKATMVILNKNDQYYSLSLDRFSEILSSYSSGYDVINDENITIGESLMLKPHQPYVIELKP